MQLLRKNKKELKNQNNLLKAQKVENYHYSCHFELNPNHVSDHLHWGAYVDEDKNVIFKIATFADVKSVQVEIKTSRKKTKKQLPLENLCNGIFSLKVNSKVARPGDRYRFIIERPNQPLKRVRDPYSSLQGKFPSWSIIYNHHSYRWHDRNWQEGKNPAKISRLAGPLRAMAPVGSLRIYEINIPSVTPEGTFLSAKSRLKIAAKMGFNAVQIMPVENCFSFNWGYDGVDKFAPNRNYGTPDDLKSLIDYAHSLNLNVIMDIVPNHFGPDLFDAGNAGPYTSGCNEFGYKFNYEGENYQHARNFIVNAALNWIINYHCDGLRFDLTKYMNSDYTMKLLATEIHFHANDAFLIAEDARENDIRVTSAFPINEVSQNIKHHKNFIDTIMTNNCSLETLGFDSEWDFPYHKQIAALMLEYWNGYPKSISSLDRVMKNSKHRVKYPMSHDEIGNIDGTRLITKIFAKEIDIYKNIPKNFKHRREQEFAQVSHFILRKLMTGSLNTMTQKDFTNFAKKYYLPLSTTRENLKQAYRKALKMHRLAVATTFSIPGPKMIFQGDEFGEMTHFKFFREFSSGYEKYLESKGYKPGRPALNDSKIGSIKYCDKYYKDLKFTGALMKDLNKINAENLCLQTGQVISSVSHPLSWVHATLSSSEKDEIFVVKNFSDIAYLNNYNIEFPIGNWKEILNTDSVKYGGEDIFLNKDKYVGDGSSQLKISIPAYGILFFKRQNKIEENN